MWDHSFLISSVWLLLVEVGLEGDVGFLEGRAGACPLEGGPESWLSGGQNCV